MKTIEMKNVLSTVSKDAKYKKDMLAVANEIKMNKDGQFTVGRLKFDATDNAYSQAFQRYGMPTTYERRLLEINPKLVADQYNYFSANAQQRDMLVRYREQSSKRTMRALLTDAYTPLDDLEIYETFNDLFGTEMKDLQIETFYYDDNRSRVRVLIPDLSMNVGTPKKGDILRVGFDIINSETGRSSLSVSPVVYRLVCTNGLKLWQNEGEVFKQRHAHVSQYDLKSNLSEAVKNAIRNGDVLIGKFAEMKEQPVEDPMALIQTLAKKKDYSDKFVKTTQDAFLIEPEKTMFGVINAFTRSAQTLNDEDRIEIEKFAGSLVKNHKQA